MTGAVAIRDVKISQARVGIEASRRVKILGPEVLEVVAPPEVSVGKVREPEPPTTLH